MTSSESFDIIIIGGGPAGSAAAITLAHGGFHPVIIERSAYSKPRIGETLPGAYAVSSSDSVSGERFLADGHIQSFALRSVWAAPRQRENESIFNPYGSGWHLDRARFDLMLALAAANAGSSLLTEAHITHLSKDQTSGWQVGVIQNNKTRFLNAPFVIDATGQTAALPVGLPRCFHVVDRLIGLLCFLARSTEPYVLVEAMDCGWWYTAPVPHGNLVIAHMTDADLFAAAGSNAPEYLRDRLPRAELTCARIGSQTTLSKPKIISASSVIRQPVCGKNWLATGDASITFDPLSGQGIYNALKGGILAGKAVLAKFYGNTESFKEYANWINSQFLSYLRMRKAFYGREQRWPESPFWRRRHSLITLQTEQTGMNKADSKAR